jgi:hypothetical protein
MPTKFKPSQTVKDRNTGKNVTQHFYIKSIPLNELEEYLTSSNAKPKIKVKVQKELARRALNS